MHALRNMLFCTCRWNAMHVQVERRVWAVLQTRTCRRPSEPAGASAVSPPALVLRPHVVHSSQYQRFVSSAPRGSANSAASSGGQDSGGGSKKGDEDEPSETQKTLRMMAGVALCASVIGGFLNIRAYERRRRREMEHGGGGEGEVTVLKGAAVGKPALGGEYTLIDHNNNVTRNSDFHGMWALIYFGFTYCPDICPNELTRLQEILSYLDKKSKGASVQPIFITIDPQRDGPAQLKEYLADWHPRLIGLTGSPVQIGDACKKFRVYANKSVVGDKPDEYLIDHSVMFYLVDPNGEFVDYYGANLTPTDIANRIMASMQSFT
jgi:cytochrome oxidase Cu insertion factor (SCO1/SenC/PrrC family)